jgi:hypothetical protein
MTAALRVFDRTARVARHAPLLGTGEGDDER